MNNRLFAHSERFVLGVGKKVGRPLESTAETQPQPQPALLRLSAMISQCFQIGLKSNMRLSETSLKFFGSSHPTVRRQLTPEIQI
jgi:hypothetical protein